MNGATQRQLARGSGLSRSGPLTSCPSELRRVQFLSGPLYKLRSTIDESQLLSDGRLIRSKRLARLEAALLISRGAVPAKKLVQLAGLVDGAEVEQLIQRLNTSYDRTNSAFRVECTATGFLMMTRPDLVSWLDRLYQRQSEMRLSQPMMETLTIVAYQQPVTRVGVEAIRGVQSSDMIRQLIDRGLVKVGGEDDSLGRPFLYVTTRAFLDMFGLGRIDDLPDYKTLGRQPEPKVLAAEDASGAADVTDGESGDAIDAASSPEDQQAA